MTSPSGDSLSVTMAKAGPVYRDASGNWTDCSTPSLSFGSSYGPCAFVTFHDAQTGSNSVAPPSNSQTDAEYDACGNLVGSGFTQNWQSYDGMMHAGWVSGNVENVARSEPPECLGTWTIVYSFTQTFSDGATLTETATGTFTVAPQDLAASETTGGRNPAELGCTQMCHGDPVNTASGDYWELTPDLGIPGRGPGLEMARTYSSLVGKSGAMTTLGHGWTMPYAMLLQASPYTGYVAIRNANGSQTMFQPNGSGGLIAPPRVMATLLHNADGTYTYTVRARTIYTFSSSGQLTSIADLNGNKTTLTYDGSGRLQKATDGVGRALTFSYGPAGLLASVTDSAGRSVSYGYDGSNDLTDVTDVRGGQWHYTYGPDHLLLMRRDANDNTVLTNTYDSSGRVLTQTDARNKTTTFDYTSGADPGIRAPARPR